MAPSPKDSASRARVIRELINIPRSSPPRSLASPTPPERDPDDSSLHLPTASSDFNPEKEALNSTQQMDTQTIPNIRSTARRYGYYDPPQPQQNVPTSAVRKEFGDFDSYEHDESEEESIEIGRGGRKSLKSTPAKSGQEDLFMSSMNFDSLYDVTPPSKSRAPTRRGNAAETGSLRRDAQIRNATNKPQTEVDTPMKAAERRKSTFSELHAKVAQEDSFQDERPPMATTNFRPTRFGTTRSRDVSVTMDPVNNLGRQSLTPQRQFRGTPRSAQTNKDTQQSFMLPNLPDLTELVSGNFKDGTPVFSKTPRARARFSSAPDPNRVPRGQPNFIPINDVPVPDDERALFAALQLLKEKISQLEKDNIEAVKNIEEQENEIIVLKAERKAQQAMRSSDSALGSTDEEGNGGANWKLQKSRLEASVETFRTRLDRTDRKLSVAETHNKRITTERDQLQEQLTKAFVTQEELSHEKTAFQHENHELRSEVDSLRAENEDLRIENEDLRETIARNQALYEEETVQIRNNLGRKESAVQKENETLHAELRRVQTHHDEETQRWARKEAELRNRKIRQEQAEFNKLKAENDALKTQVQNAKLQRDKDEQHWRHEEAELRDRLDRRDETIRHFQDNNPDEANETLRIDNDHLRIQLEKLAAERDEEQQLWQRKEERLRRKIEKREDAVRDMQEMTRDIAFARRAATEHPQPSGPSARNTNSGIKRAASGRRGKDTQMRLSDAVEQEIRKSKTVASAAASRRPENPVASRLMRESSAPVQQRVENDSEVDSTTDLSIAPARRRQRNAQSEAKKRSSIAAPAEAEDLDYTYLSLMDGNEISRLRKVLEEERAEMRRKATMEPAQEEKNETLRSVMSNKGATQPSLPRKSSLRDVSKRFSAIPPPKADDPTRTEVSVLSNSSKRRRSAPVEMTSAFIIPDITVRIPQRALETVHEAKDCTVCQRSVSDSNVPRLGSIQSKVDIPQPVPVSSRNIEDSNATIRPAQSPQDALALVLKELEDELTHLKFDLATNEALLQSHDPSLGKRKRKEVQTKIFALLKAIDVKSDQIYALHDVLEGQKADGLLDAHRNDMDRTRMTEEEVDNTLRSVGLDPKEARRGKKVVIEDFEHSEREDGIGESEEEDLPWSGISDTESLPARR